MLCHLPPPYPDELLYSVIARYLNHIGTANRCAALAHIFGRKKRLTVDLPSSLNSVAERTWLVWGMTGDEIVNQLTLFPYYARYVPRQRAAWCLDMLRSDNGAGVHARIGVNARRIGVPQFLRFCPTCRSFDLDCYGETYWRRAHQIAGVLVCQDHGDLLVESTAPIKTKSIVAYFDATQSTAGIASADPSNISGSDAVNALKIANRCRDMLLGPIASWPHEAMPRAYRQAALECGFSDGIARLSHAKFEKAFVTLYGESLLSKFGFKVHLGKDFSGVRSFFYDSLVFRAQHPLQHALIQIFLESAPIDTSRKIPFRLGPWKCPNPYATHERQFPIERASIRVLDSGEFVASAKCRCGFRFTFSRVNDSDPNLPVVKNTRGFGPAWEAEAKRLRQSGLRTGAIAKKMGISYKTVERLFREKPSKDRISLRQIEAWRQEWLKLLDQDPDRKWTVARSKNGGLYTRLRRWDWDWMQAQSPNRKTRSVVNRRVDWATRDSEWSQKLKAAAQKLKTTGFSRRITPTTIIYVSGLPTSIFSPYYLDQMPTCRAVLKECSDQSLDDSRERRLQATISQVHERGLPPKEWVLRKLSGLSGKKLSPRLNAVLQGLVSSS